MRTKEKKRKYYVLKCLNCKKFERCNVAELFKMFYEECKDFEERDEYESSRYLNKLEKLLLTLKTDIRVVVFKEKSVMSQIRRVFREK